MLKEQVMARGGHLT